MSEISFNRRPKKQVLILAGFILVCFAVAAIGGAVTSPRIQGWYAELSKPSWTPPGWLFGPVWSLLYLLMAISAWLVWRDGGFIKVRWAWVAFGVQLVLNCLWSVIFFGMQQPGFAAVELILLWLAIIATIILFWRTHSVAGALLLPYLLWVTFAAALNVAIWQMNVS